MAQAGATPSGSNFEVAEPILNSPFDEPAEHWLIRDGEQPVKLPGRRPAGYWYRDPKAPQANDAHAARGQWRELVLVNLIRREMDRWRSEGRPGITRTTRELLDYWTREGGIRACSSLSGKPPRPSSF